MGRFTALLLCVFVLASVPARATAPPTFTFQGVLRNNSGALQSAMFNVTVVLWNAQTGGTMIATYPSNVVMAQNGLFSVNITDANLPSLLSPQPSVWVELDVTGIGNFPRQQLTSNLFSMESVTTDKIQNVSVSASTPASGQLLGYNGATTQWEPTSLLKSHFNSGFVAVTNSRNYVWAPAFVPAVNASCLVTATGYTFNVATGQAFCSVGVNKAGTPTLGETALATYNAAPANFVPGTAHDLFTVTAGQSTQLGCVFDLTPAVGQQVRCVLTYICVP